MIHPIHHGYIMSVRVPVFQYTGQVIAIIHCRDDVGGSPERCHFSKEEIEEAVAFQEKYFDSWIELRGERSLVDKE